MPSLSDALGRIVTMDAPPRRIVSLVPSITETLFAFGLGDAVVGVTKFCVEPADGVRPKTRVGGTKDPNIDAIRSLRPDLIVVNVEENERQAVGRLIATGANVFVTYPRTIAEGIEMMRRLAALTGAGEAARPFIEDAEQERSRAEAASAGTGSPRVFCPIWRAPGGPLQDYQRVSWMTIGPDTYMHDFIRVCGGENIFGDSVQRYPSVTAEEVAARSPEVILLPDEPYRFRQRHIPEFYVLGQVPAVQKGRIYLVDGKKLSWYGSRIGPSIRSLRPLLAAAQRGFA